MFVQSRKPMDSSKATRSKSTDITNSQISSIATFTIHIGQLQKFKDLASLCIRLAKENDTGTLGYQWFYHDKLLTCIVVETYIDSDAMLAHMEHVGPGIKQILEISSISSKILGPASEKLRRTMSGFDVQFFDIEMGF